MSRDIYERYLNSIKTNDNINVNNDDISTNKEAFLITNQNTLRNDNETLDVLKNISLKLDSFVNNQHENITNDRIVDSIGYDILIKNGNVVIPGEGVIKTNITIKNGKIISLADSDIVNAKEIIDAKGKYVVPGIIDPHIHLGLFASLEKELETETVAALFGGVTTAGCFIGSDNSHFKSFPNISETINSKSHIDIIPHLVINSQVQINEIRDYVEHLGITSFKIYMNGIPGLITDVDDGFILDLFDEIKKTNKKCIVCVHSENKYLVQRATQKMKDLKGDNANIVDWSSTHPNIAEEEAVMRISFLAERSEVPVYLVHISSYDAINRIRSMKPFNKYISIETTSPYLSLTKHSVNDNTIKQEPPFKDDKDVEALWKAVADGVVDTIGTDNVTITKKEKNIDDTIWNVMPGYPALETHLPILLNEGVIKRKIPIEKIIEKITKNPAKTFGIYPKKGSMLPGSDADIVIIDLNKTKEILATNLSSRSDFSLYEGKTIQGWPIMTIKSGEVVIRDNNFVGQNVIGKYIER